MSEFVTTSKSRTVTAHGIFNNDMMADLNAYNERKEAERQEMLVEQEKKEEKIKNYNQELYEEDLINDPYEKNWRTKNHKYNAGLGN